MLTAYESESIHTIRPSAIAVLFLNFWKISRKLNIHANTLFSRVFLRCLILWGPFVWKTYLCCAKRWNLRFCRFFRCFGLLFIQGLGLPGGLEKGAEQFRKLSSLVIWKNQLKTVFRILGCCLGWFLGDRWPRKSIFLGGCLGPCLNRVGFISESLWGCIFVFVGVFVDNVFV